MAAAKAPKETEGTTTLDSDITKPATTAPGDAPADTTNPEEKAVSVNPSPGEEAIEAGTVNAVKPAPKRAQAAKPRKRERTETYTAVRPDGEEITIHRNIETGETKIAE